ncbi:hypothetical protein VTN96DRAFT_5721 [Rasamsonia emersonii]
MTSKTIACIKPSLTLSMLVSWRSVSLMKTEFFFQAFENLKPGGYFEIGGGSGYFFSDDDTIKKAENCQLLLKNLHTAANKFGKTLDNVHLWKEKVEKAGFVDVKESVFKVPIGPWPKDPKLKEIGRYQQYQQIQALEFYTPALLSRVLGWNNMEIQVILSKAQSELKDHSIHLYTTVHYVYGRKP